MKAQGDALRTERAKCSSIPEISYIVFNAVFKQQMPVFILKRHRPVVFCLIINVLFQCQTMGRADREDAVSALPVKRRGTGRFRFQPFRRAGFDFLNQIGRCTGAGHGDQQVNMVGNRASLEQCPFLVSNNTADVCVEFVADVISQQRLPVLRRKDQMCENLGEGLRHKITPFQGLENWRDVFPYTHVTMNQYPGRCPENKAQTKSRPEGAEHCSAHHPLTRKTM